MASGGGRGRAGDERLYQLFFENSAEAFYVMPQALDGSPEAFLDVNQRACDMLGYSRDELLSIPPLAIDAETSEGIWRAAHERLSRRGHDLYYRRHRRRDGTTLPVEISARVFEQGGRSYVLAVVRDISSDQLAEARLENSQRDLQALVDASHELSALVAIDTTILRINAAGAARFGSTPDALKGRKLTDLSPSEIAPRRVEVAQQVIRQRRTITFRDFRDGMWLEHAVSPVIDDNGRVSRFALFSRDVTVPHLRREVDSLFNDIDRDVLNGTPVPKLVSFACDHLGRAFNSALVWYQAADAATTESLAVAQGRWSQELQTFPQLSPEHVGQKPSPGSPLEVIKAGSNPGVSLLLNSGGHEPASAALLKVNTPEGQGLLVITSLCATAFDQEPVVELLLHTAGRLEVAFEMAAEQRQLGLVKQALKTAHSAVIISDREGRIVWSNMAFSRFTGYQDGEVLSVHQLEISTLEEPRPAGPPPHATPADLYPTYQVDPFRHVMASGEVWSGEALSCRKDGSRYTVLQTITPVFNDDGTISHLIAIQDDITERKLNEEEIRYLAEHDVLTGLHNRAYLIRQLEHLLTVDRRYPRRSLGVLYLDIDRFKEINDAFGHTHGDEVLACFAQRLREVVRDGDLIGRIGGDEFVLVLIDIREAGEAKAVADKLLASLAKPLDCTEHPLTVTSSIGISISPGNGETPESLLKRADAAMYEAKRRGRANACLWESIEETG